MLFSNDLPTLCYEYRIRNFGRLEIKVWQESHLCYKCWWYYRWHCDCRQLCKTLRVGLPSFQSCPQRRPKASLKKI